jgi:hypothetical protein
MFLGALNFKVHIQEKLSFLVHALQSSISHSYTPIRSSVLRKYHSVKSLSCIATKTKDENTVYYGEDYDDEL